MADSEVGSVGCLDRPSSGAAGTNVKQLAAVSGMSVGCLLDGIVIAYSSPAIPSLLAKVRLLTADDKDWGGREDFLFRLILRGDIALNCKYLELQVWTGQFQASVKGIWTHFKQNKSSYKYTEN